MTQTREIALTTLSIRYSVRRSARARRLSLRFLPLHGFEVVLPARTPLREVEPFVRAMEPWIARTLARHSGAIGRPRVLADGSAVPFLGSVLVLRVDPMPAGRSAFIRRHGDALHVRCDPDDQRALAALVQTWVRRAAREEIAGRAGAHARALGVEYGRIAIKDTRTRWGSCSTKGNLNFSWRLLLAPAEVLDYVVAHEVAHLVEMNHSARFWQVVAGLCPQYARPRAWLRANGHALAAWPVVAL